MALFKKQVLEPRVRPSRIPVRSIPLPSEPIVLAGLKGSQCAFYARTLAKRLFGLRYARGHAWEYPISNRVVWWAKSASDNSYEKELKPGQIVGIRYPASPEQKDHPERPFTHVAIFLGYEKSQPTIAHQFGPVFRRDVLPEFLTQKGCSVVALFEPAGLGQRIRNVTRRIRNRIRKKQ